MLKENYHLAINLKKYLDIFQILIQTGSYKMINKCAVVLCGGKGSRLGALGKKIPKTLVKVQNKEILWYIIQFLKFSGFNNIILPLGYRGEQIKKFLKKIMILEYKSKHLIQVLILILVQELKKLQIILRNQIFYF